ncbi:MAG: MerR family transcriptional regulator [Syntrophomonadaceae bacterium]|jgi:DNA-binding transcriptional MerR regulator
MKERYYKIGEVAEILGLEQHTLRYLENSLKLKIKRDERGDRLYTESDLDSLRLIIQLKEKGLNTTAIKLALDNAEEVKEQSMAPRVVFSTSDVVQAMGDLKKIIVQNEELLLQNQRLEERIAALEKKIEQVNKEGQKKINEFLDLWKAEQDSRNKSWFSLFKKK